MSETFYRRNDVASVFTGLRNDLRQGNDTANRADWSEVLADALNVDTAMFNIKHFTPALVGRLHTLMRIPQEPARDPTKDEFARALQNFINRRKDVWAFFADKGNAIDLEDSAELGGNL